MQPRQPHRLPGCQGLPNLKSNGRFNHNESHVCTLPFAFSVFSSFGDEHCGYSLCTFIFYVACVAIEHTTAQMMLLISALLLLALTPTSLAEQLLSLPPMAPPATFTETFTPVPIEAVTTITQTLPSLPTLPSPSSLPFKETSVLIDGPVQTVVSLPVGDIYHQVPRGRFLGSILGSIIAVVCELQ